MVRRTVPFLKLPAQAFCLGQALRRPLCLSQRRECFAQLVEEVALEREIIHRMDQFERTLIARNR
jgi:hypothetical protein